MTTRERWIATIDLLIEEFKAIEADDTLALTDEGMSLAIDHEGVAHLLHRATELRLTVESVVPSEFRA